MWYMYILRTQSGTLYTGITRDLQRRFTEHYQGKGGHYTSYNRPKKIEYTETFRTQSEAEKRECQIKRWSKSKKLALIQGNEQKLRELSISRD